MIGWPENCSADLDGDVFYYKGEPVVISHWSIWHDGYYAGYKAAIDDVKRILGIDPDEKKEAAG